MTETPDETPVLQGYEITWDGGGWVARSSSSTIVLRGRDQDELNEQRHRVYSAALSGLQDLLKDYDPGGFRKSCLARQTRDDEPADEPRTE